MTEDWIKNLRQDLMQMVLADQCLDDDDLLAQAAYRITQSHSEEARQALAFGLFSTLGISPRKNRRRGRPRKRLA